MSFRGPLFSGRSNARRRSICFGVLAILWLLGFTLHLAGGFIHLLLVVALVVLVINLVSGRRVA